MNIFSNLIFLFIIQKALPLAGKQMIKDCGTLEKYIMQLAYVSVSLFTVKRNS